MQKLAYSRYGIYNKAANTTAQKLNTELKEKCILLDNIISSSKQAKLGILI